VIALDKTGTVTTGEPAVTKVVPMGGDPGAADDLLRIAASVEQGSEHPLGAAVVREARKRSLLLAPAEEVAAVVGRGITGRVEGHRVDTGSLRMMQGVPMETEGLAARARELEGEGNTVLWVAVDGKPKGLIAVADTLKSDARRAVAKMHVMGLRVVLVTGDNAVTADAVGRQIGADTVVSDVLPADKAEVVDHLKKESGGFVAMVGDGINDAPALARADVGIAIGSGTDVAIEAADVTLMRSDVTSVHRAIRLSRDAMRVVRQNLFWAFFYNVVLIPVAAGALHPFEFMPRMLRDLHPMVAAFAMAFSSLTVVGNSLRLRRVRL
jgi:Cu+-exporting ATPase